MSLPFEHFEGKPHGKYPIDRPCSACSAGDSAMEYHDHEPPYRKGYGPKADDPGLEKARQIQQWMHDAAGDILNNRYSSRRVAQIIADHAPDARTVQREMVDACLNVEEMRGAIARGWCHDANRHKEMDTELGEAIRIEIEKAIRARFPEVLK